MVKQAGNFASDNEREKIRIRKFPRTQSDYYKLTANKYTKSQFWLLQTSRFRRPQTDKRRLQRLKRLKCRILNTNNNLYKQRNAFIKLAGAFQETIFRKKWHPSQHGLPYFRVLRRFRNGETHATAYCRGHTIRNIFVSTTNECEPIP